jgi:hypothetical protein
MGIKILTIPGVCGGICVCIIFIGYRIYIKYSIFISCRKKENKEKESTFLYMPYPKYVET